MGNRDFPHAFWPMHSIRVAYITGCSCLKARQTRQLLVCSPMAVGSEQAYEHCLQSYRQPRTVAAQIEHSGQFSSLPIHLTLVVAGPRAIDIGFQKPHPVHDAAGSHPLIIFCLPEQELFGHNARPG